MPTAKKPKKKYKPKPVLQDNLGYVLTGVRPIEQSKLVNLKLKNHMALKAMTSGSAHRDDWQVLCAAFNMAAVLCDQSVGTEYLQLVKDGMKAHASCRRRFDVVGKLGYSGVELNAVNTAMEVHDAQLEAITVIQVEDAVREVNRRLAAKHFEFTTEGV